MAGILRRHENPQNVNREMTRQTQTSEPSSWSSSGDPFRLWGSMNPFRRLFEIFGGDPFAELTSGFPSTDRRFAPDLEVREKTDCYVICADLPGLTADDVNVELIGNRLLIRGKREEEEREEGDQYWAYERSYGSFARSFVLPEGISPDQIDARLECGVLEVRIPKVKHEQSTKIPVQNAESGPMQKQSPGSSHHAQSGSGLSGSTGATQTGTMTSTGQESSPGGAHEKAA